MVLWPSDSVPYQTEYRLHIDGQSVVWPNDGTPVTLSSQTFSPAQPCNNLAGGAHIFEWVGPGDKVALTTSPLEFTSGRTHELVVYGNSSSLQYNFFGNPEAELDAVPAGSILARVLNLRTDVGGASILACPLAATSVLDCTPAKSGLAYGELWKQTFTRDMSLAIACAPLSSTELCITEPLSQRCTNGTNEGADPKSETIVLLDGADGKAHLVTFDVGGNNCSL